MGDTDKKLDEINETSKSSLRPIGQFGGILTAIHQDLERVNQRENA